MKTLAQFKAENSVTSITFIKSKKAPFRQFCTIGNNSLVVSKEADLKLPLYIIPFSTFNNGVDASDGTTEKPNSFVIINANVEIGDTI